MSDAYAIFIALIAFYKNGEEGGRIASIFKVIDSQTLWTIVIKLLPWLKTNGTKGVPLELGTNSWGKSLIQLLNQDQTLSVLLRLEGNSVILKEGISNDELQLIKEAAKTAYNPPLMR
jgi:hypothetical protein